MPKRITVVVSQGQSHNPARRKLEEEIVGGLLGQRGVDVTVVPHLYDLAPGGTGILCLEGIAGDLIVCAWLFPRAAHWTLNRQGIRGRFGVTLLEEKIDDESDEEGEDSGDDVPDEAAKERVAERLDLPNRTIYCLDLRARNNAAAFIDEVRRIANEAATDPLPLGAWLQGAPQPQQVERYLNPTPGNVDHQGNGHRDGNGAVPQIGDDASFQGNGLSQEHAHADVGMAPQLETAAGPVGEAESASAETPPAQPRVVAEEAPRRWYPVIDFSRCTNCLECIDFCLFGVYGVDNLQTIVVEQPDNCRKGCPACSRVCPENAIMFPQHKTPAIAGSPEEIGGLKIDLSKLFGAPNVDAVDVAVLERDEQLLLAGREAVGHEVGLARRQAGRPSKPKDELDSLIDELDRFAT